MIRDANVKRVVAVAWNTAIEHDEMAHPVVLSNHAACNAMPT